jgi:Tfp pilus assembly protein PilF
MRTRNWFKNALETIGGALLFPIKLLFLPFRLVDLFAGLFHEDGADARKLGWFARARRLATAPVKAPLAFIARVFRKGKAVELMYFVPGLTLLSFFVFVGYQLHFNKAAIEQRYLIGASRSIANQNPELAKKYFQRFLEKDELPDNLTYSWALILRMAGDLEQANDLFRKIAPSNSSGYPAAHQVLATQMAIEFQQSTPDESLLSELHWHLKNSGEPTSAIEQAWATYYVANKQPDLAISHLENAAVQMPRLYLALADLYQEQGLEEKRIGALLTAKRKFGTNLADNPLDQDSRVILSRVILELNDPVAAEDILLSGLRIYQNLQLANELCNFYILRFDRASNSGTETHESAKLSTVQKFDMLRRSLAICPEHSPTYSRLASLTTAPEVTLQNQLKADFVSIVTSEYSSALAHVCLGHLESQAGNIDDANWHLKQAWSLQTDFGTVASRLAQAFASQDSPNIEWALKLAKQSVAYSQKDCEFRLVLAEMYLRREDFSAAKKELHKLLEDGHELARVHELLVVTYGSLENLERARHHSDKASELRNESN